MSWTWVALVGWAVLVALTLALGALNRRKIRRALDMRGEVIGLKRRWRWESDADYAYRLRLRLSSLECPMGSLDYLSRMLRSEFGKGVDVGRAGPATVRVSAPGLSPSDRLRLQALAEDYVPAGVSVSQDWSEQ